MVVGKEGNYLIGFLFYFTVEEYSGMLGQLQYLGGLKLSNLTEFGLV